MEGTNHEVKILLSNLKIKRDDLSHVKLDDYLKKSEAQDVYQAGDLILYESYRHLALVLEMKPDLLRVLTTQNKVEQVRLSDVSKKVIYR